MESNQIGDTGAVGLFEGLKRNVALLDLKFVIRVQCRVPYRCYERDVDGDGGGGDVFLPFWRRNCMPTRLMRSVLISRDGNNLSRALLNYRVKSFFPLVLKTTKSATIPAWQLVMR